MSQPTLFGPGSPSQDGQGDPPAAPHLDEELLAAVYQRQGRSLDDLPYTDEFETIYAAAVGDSPDEPLAGTTRAQLLHRLHNIRKAGRLPRVGRGSAPPVRISAQQQRLLAQLVEAALGRISLRDNLPYTDLFDILVARFNTAAGLDLSPHQVWRLVAKLAK